MNESVISWNIPNFLTVVLMVAITWSALGFISHLFRKQVSKPSNPQTDVAA